MVKVIVDDELSTAEMRLGPEVDRVIADALDAKLVGHVPAEGTVKAQPNGHAPK